MSLFSHISPSYEDSAEIKYAAIMFSSGDNLASVR